MGGESSRRTQMLLGVGLVGLIVGLVMLVAGAATGWLLPDDPPKANLLRNQSAKVGYFEFLSRGFFWVLRSCVGKVRLLVDKQQEADLCVSFIVLIT
jgi:hypothetical protein